jgi:arylsulfatase
MLRATKRPAWQGAVLCTVVGIALITGQPDYALVVRAEQNPQAAQGIDRTVLPAPEPTRPAITEVDARKAKAPPRFEVKAPPGAPNVVIVLIDDIGFGHSSAFGGPCQMPTCEKLANNGLRFNRFHTTSLCSPTRMALLTGRNHHVCNTGAVMELATGFPGNTGVPPNSVTPLA